MVKQGTANAIKNAWRMNWKGCERKVVFCLKVLNRHCGTNLDGLSRALEPGTSGTAVILFLCRTFTRFLTVYEFCDQCDISISIYTVSEKDCTPFFFLFFFSLSRCPVCGEWCKLHWLLLDTPSFDWNTRRSRGHKMFKMAPTKQQKAFCAVEYAKTTSGAFAFA